MQWPLSSTTRHQALIELKALQGKRHGSFKRMWQRGLQATPQREGGERGRGGAGEANASRQVRWRLESRPKWLVDGAT